MHFKKSATGIAITLGLAVAAGPVAAQEFPTKPISIIVAFGAGGGAGEGLPQDADREASGG